MEGGRQRGKQRRLCLANIKDWTGTGPDGGPSQRNLDWPRLRRSCVSSFPHFLQRVVFAGLFRVRSVLIKRVMMIDDD